MAAVFELALPSVQAVPGPHTPPPSGAVMSGTGRSTATLTDPSTDPEVRLWRALHMARLHDRPEDIVDAEDALYRHYLPLAHALAAAHPAGTDAPTAARHAAETALAAAIVAWRYRDPEEFQPWAGKHIRIALAALTTPSADRPRAGSAWRRPPPASHV